MPATIGMGLSWVGQGWPIRLREAARNDAAAAISACVLGGPRNDRSEVRGSKTLLTRVGLPACPPPRNLAGATECHYVGLASPKLQEHDTARAEALIAVSGKCNSKRMT